MSDVLKLKEDIFFKAKSRDFDDYLTWIPQGSLVEQIQDPQIKEGGREFKIYRHIQSGLILSISADMVER